MPPVPLGPASTDQPGKASKPTPMALVRCGRFGEPKDLACAAAWLACDASHYIVGTTHFIDGGMPLYPGLAGNG
jgi:NAD(P)-dependent dehydrogenase (short-subunit alcohol dehydrogenase family)